MQNINNTLIPETEIETALINTFIDSELPTIFMNNLGVIGDRYVVHFDRGTGVGHIDANGRAYRKALIRDSKKLETDSPYAMFFNAPNPLQYNIGVEAWVRDQDGRPVVCWEVCGDFPGLVIRDGNSEIGRSIWPCWVFFGEDAPSQS